MANGYMANNAHTLNMQLHLYASSTKKYNINMVDYYMDYSKTHLHTLTSKNIKKNTMYEAYIISSVSFTRPI
jgi:hypothetical protein